MAETTLDERGVGDDRSARQELAIAVGARSAAQVQPARRAMVAHFRSGRPALVQAVYQKLPARPAASLRRARMMGPTRAARSSK